MSRLNWNECDDEEHQRLANLWRGRWVIQRRSKKGQALLREMVDVLLALPEKRLAGGAIVRNGCACAGGELLVARAMQNGETRESALAQLAELQAWRIDDYGETMDDLLTQYGLQQTIAFALVAENDGGYCERKMTDEERYERVLSWCRENIIGARDTSGPGTEEAGPRAERGQADGG